MMPFTLLTIVTPHDAALIPSTPRRIENSTPSPFAANACDDPQLVACTPQWASPGVSTLLNQFDSTCLC